MGQVSLEQVTQLWNDLESSGKIEIIDGDGNESVYLNCMNEGIREFLENTEVTSHLIDEMSALEEEIDAE